MAAFGPRLAAAGLISEQEVTDCLALFVDRDRVFRTARLVSAWGRLPD